MRALIGNFAVGNPVQFNRPDGAGYDFLADQVLALDRINPQIAARMLGALRSLALPGKRPPGQGAQGVAAHRAHQTAVAGRAGNRLASARRVIAENL